jgi:stage V sporulation protein G
MEITRVKIDALFDVKAYASITLDDCFVIHGFELSHGKNGYSIRMPRTKRPDGTYVDVGLPLNNETRQMIQEKVVAEYEKIAGESVTRGR